MEVKIAKANTCLFYTVEVTRITDDGRSTYRQYVNNLNLAELRKLRDAIDARLFEEVVVELGGSCR